MSDISENSLVNIATPLGDLQNESTATDIKMLNEEHEKFNLVNNSAGTSNKVINITSGKENNFQQEADTMSTGSSMSGLPESYDLSQSTRSFSYEPRSTSDAETLLESVSKTQYYQSQDKEFNDSGSITSGTSLNGVFVTENVSRSSSLSSSTVHVSHQRVSSQDWVTFDDSKTSKKSMQVRPPDIPSRKQILPILDKTQSNTVDLLSMDNEMLSEHLVKSSELFSKEVPPIPDRVLSPLQMTLMTSPCESPTFSNFHLPPPPVVSPAGVSKRQGRSRTASNNSTPFKIPPPVSSNTASSGPPVPARKNILSQHTNSGVTYGGHNLPEPSSSFNWVTFTQAGISQENITESDGSFRTTTSTSSHSSMSEVSRSNTASIDIDSLNIKSKDLKNADLMDSQWMEATLTESLKPTKKKKGGYQHLSCSSDEDEKLDITAGDNVTIEVTDMSPVKPLSRWAPIPNEADDVAGSSGNISNRNSLVDDEANDDLDLEDVFGLDINRLSTDMSGLKGFNRADKGSQNNLVDFSHSSEKLGHSSADEDESSEEELQTVFDMTAQGDSLKRRVKRNPDSVKLSSNDPSSAVPITSNVSSRSTSCITEVLEPSTPVETSKCHSNLGSTSTNPFWSHSPLGETVSLASTTSESNPFDRIQFQSTSSAAANESPLATIKQPIGATFPMLPPPPKSAKSRNISGSLGRRRVQNNLSSSPLFSSTSGNDSDVNKTKASLSLSVKNLSVCRTSLKSDNANVHELLTQRTTNPGHLVVDNTSSSSMLDLATTNAVNEEVAKSNPNQFDATILQTTLSILDLFPQPSTDPTSPVNLEHADVADDQVSPVSPELFDIKYNSVQALDKLGNNILAETPQSADVEKSEPKTPTCLKKDIVVPSATEWKMLLRFPRQKRMMSSRKWVDIFVRLKQDQIEYPTVQLYHNRTSKDPFFFIELFKHDWQLTQPKLQRHQATATQPRDVNIDPKRKLHSIKFMRVHYKEKRAFMNKRDKYVTRVPSGFKHSLKSAQLVKLGSHSYLDILSFLLAVSDSSFTSHKALASQPSLDRSPSVKYHSRDEIFFEVHDEFKASVNSNGEIEDCDVTVHLSATSFLSGDPMATLSLNDVRVQGREVVSRCDIIPSSNNTWIKICDVEVHKCAPSGYDEASASITFNPPDACRFELARFHCPYVEKDPPVFTRASISVKGTRVSVRCVVRSSPTHSANKDSLIQISCEDLSIRFAVPEAWQSAFRKTGRFGVKSVHAKRVAKRAPGQSTSFHQGAVCSKAILEASVGSAKYEAAYDAIVWRIKRFPEKNAAQNTPEVFSCTVELSSEHNLPPVETWKKYKSCQIEYSMPNTTASNACVRSVNLPNSSRAERFACYSSHYLYTVGIAVTHERDASHHEKPSCAVQ